MTVPRIEGYRFGQIIIDGRRYARDVIVYPDHVDDRWRREEGHSVAPADVWEVVEMRPEVLVIGQGAVGRMEVPDETVEVLEAAGIEVIAEPTGQAWETYNRLREARRTVAALHLTC
jgi:hypothetical protein